MPKNPQLHRDVLPIPDITPVGLTTYDVKDPDTAFPPIRQLRPPDGAPNVLVGPCSFTRLRSTGGAPSAAASVEAEAGRRAGVRPASEGLASRAGVAGAGVVRT
jgi:hypothetical protein